MATYKYRFSVTQGAPIDVTIEGQQGQTLDDLLPTALAEAQAENDTASLFFCVPADEWPPEWDVQ